MIVVCLNGEEKQLHESMPLADALAHWGYQGEAFAVAINENFIPRSHYRQKQIATGDVIEVVSPLQGG